VLFDGLLEDEEVIEAVELLVDDVNELEYELADELKLEELEDLVTTDDVVLDRVKVDDTGQLELGGWL
jgi:hypothetical protein